MKLLFIVSKFPCYDEAFILREIFALSRKVNIHIFSLKKSREKIVHREAAELLPNTFYVPYLLSWQIIKAHFRVVTKHPFRYLKALGRLVCGNAGSAEFLFKSAALFPKAVYLADWVLENKVTHIHAYWATYPASVALLVHEIARIPFSFTGHAHDIYLNATYLKEKIMRASFVSTCTEQNKVYLEQVAPHCPEERIRVIHHGIDLDSYLVSDKPEKECLDILSVGTLQEHKGFQYLLEALSILKEKGLRFHCTIVGGGPLELDIGRHVQLFGLEAEVTLTGPLTQAEVIPFYKRADIFVLMAQPEWHWGIPNVIIEALAAKTCVITTRFGSVTELIKDGITGLLLPAKEPDALAHAIERLQKDLDLRKSLAEAGHEMIIRHFNLDKNVDKYLRLLRGEKVAEKNQINAGRRICHLIWALEPGGAERQVITMATWQKEHDDEPVVVCLTRRGIWAEELEKKGVPVFLIRKGVGIDFSIIGKLARFLRDHAIQILHTHIPTASLWGRLAVLKAGTCKVVVSEHSDLAVRDFRFRWINLLLSRWTDAYHTVSEHIRDMMVKSGIKQDQIAVIHNGIEENGISHRDDSVKLRKDLGIAEGAPVIGTVGRLEPRKDQVTFLKACREIKQARPEARFVLVGGGPCEKELRGQAETLGLNGSLYFAGVRQDVGSFLDCMDVFVLSSITEGISTSLLEAMSRKKACVVTNVGGNPEVISEGENGLLVPKENAHALAEAILKVLSDTKLKSRLSTHALETVQKHFSIEAMMTGVDELYEKICK